MKKIFYIGILTFILFEFLVNYLIMPHPGSQHLNSVEFAHALYQGKIFIEIALLLLILYSAIKLFKSGKIIIPILFIIAGIVSYISFTIIFTAEYRYRLPNNLTFELDSNSKVDLEIPIIGIEFNGEAKAYSVPFIRYHHQVIDKIGGKDVIVTYCGICRTGRVYEPIVNDKMAKFRLVGVNRFNAMFEDNFTKSWWSQETGVCIAGKLKGERLPEVNCNNMVLRKWLELYPNSKIMQPDPDFIRKYKTRNDDYAANDRNPAILEEGGTWSTHTYIVGISHNGNAIAYEWNYIVNHNMINGKIGETKFCLMLSNDNKSFSVLENPSVNDGYLNNDTLYIDSIPYNFAGINLINSTQELKKINAYREFWFSWKYAYPHTTKGH